MSKTEESILKQAYASFNARDIDGVLKLMHTDADWPNGWEGGRVHGHDEVRDYWTRQWAVLDPHVEPVGFQPDDSGRTVVDVHTVVRDQSGKIVADERIKHAYVIEDGLILSMEIEKA